MIEQSESIKHLIISLRGAQNELGAVSENAYNPFLKNNYADLGEHIKTIKPVFYKYDLVVSQFVTGSDNEIGVTTMLMHESGEWLKSTATIPLEQEKGNSKAQTAGKAISYIRRYSLAAIANVYSGDDNDGNIEKAEPKKPERKTPKQEKKELGYVDKKEEIPFNIMEFIVEHTDIETVHHAAKWMTKITQEGASPTKANVVALRNKYNKEKE